MGRLKKSRSTLKVNPGISQPSSVDPESTKRFIKKKPPKISINEYVDGISQGNRTLLSRAITLIESQLDKDKKISQKIVTQCHTKGHASKRIGITGVPGVGKSAFIEAFGTYLTGLGLKIAVLAIDPSSQRSKGSILGDKTRMESLSNNPNAFIRPSSSAGSLGGVAQKTRESLILCEAAGFDIILIETVGVGQSEVTVKSMVDFFLLLMLAGAGDELQGIKRGIMEMADVIAITKADGNNREASELAKAEYKNALHLLPAHTSGWTPEVVTVSALENEGLNDLWEITENYFSAIESSGYLKQNRMEQSKERMHQTIQQNLYDHFYHHPEVEKTLKETERMVLDGSMSSYGAAAKLLELYWVKRKSKK